MCRRSHPFPVHVRRGEHRGEDLPPQPPGSLRGPNQYSELLWTSPRCGWTRTDRHTDSSRFSPTDTLQKQFAHARSPRIDETLWRLPSGAHARWTVCVSRAQCSPRTSDRTEWSPRVTCCTGCHLRLCVEAVVGRSRF